MKKLILSVGIIGLSLSCFSVKAQVVVDTISNFAHKTSTSKKDSTITTSYLFTILGSNGTYSLDLKRRIKDTTTVLVKGCHLYRLDPFLINNCIKRYIEEDENLKANMDLILNRIRQDVVDYVNVKKIEGNGDVSTKKYSKILFDYTMKAHLNAAIYSDLQGIQDNTPNGLVQVESYFTVPLNRSYFKVGKNSKLFFFRNMMVPSIQWTKIDKKNRYLPTRYQQQYDSVNVNGQKVLDTTKRLLNTFDLLQYANVVGTIHVNIVTFEAGDGSKIYIDGVGKYVRTGVVDSLPAPIRTYNVNSFGYGFHAKLKTRYYNIPRTSWQAQLNASYSLFWLNMNRADFTQVSGEQYLHRPQIVKVEDSELKNFAITNTIIQLSFKQNTVNSNDTFLRVVLFDNMFSASQGSTAWNNFVQFQIGKTFNLFGTPLTDATAKLDEQLK